MTDNTKNSKKWDNLFHYAPGKKRAAREKGEDRAFAECFDKINVIAIADGISSAGPLSAVAAYVITKVIVPFLKNKFENIWELPPEKLFNFLSRELGEEFFATLNRYCKDNGHPEILTNGSLNDNTNKYRTTVIACAVCENRMIFVKFGNGFAAVCGKDGAYLLSASKNESYTTADIMLISDAANSEFEIGRYFLDDNIRSIALFSDGADYNTELYDEKNHKLSSGYVEWLENAVKSEEIFKNAVKKIAADNNKSTDDISVAVMFDKNEEIFYNISEKSPLKPLYKLYESYESPINKESEKNGKNEEPLVIHNQEKPEVIVMEKKTEFPQTQIAKKNRKESKTNINHAEKTKKPYIVGNAINNLKNINIPIISVIAVLVFAVISFFFGRLSISFSPVNNFENITEITQAEMKETETVRENDNGKADTTVKEQFISVKNIEIKIEPSMQPVEFGTILEFTGTIEPIDATEQEIIWSVNNKEIIGKNWTAEIAGDITVTAEIKNGIGKNEDFMRNFYINVKDKFIPVEKITGVAEETEAGKPLELLGTVEPENATNQEIIWIVNGKKIDGNNWTAEIAGDITVTAEIKNGTGENEDFTQDFHINVKFIPVTEIQIDLPQTIEAGDTLKLNGKVKPDNATNQTIMWTITKPDKTTEENLNNGTLINPTLSGIMNIKATVANGQSENVDFTRNFSITVTAAKPAAENAVINNIYIKYKINRNLCTTDLNVRPSPEQNNMNFLHTYASNWQGEITAVLDESGKEILKTEKKDGSENTFILIYYDDNDKSKTGWVNQRYLEKISN